MTRSLMEGISTYTMYGTLLVLPFLYLYRKWVQGGTCTSNVRLDGKTIIITGANMGIGKETAIELAKRGARVVMACRSQKKSESALDDVRRQSGSDMVFLELLDLASLKSVRDFARGFVEKYQKLHILINNAGVLCDYTKTEDGFEAAFGVNHLGHFALTNLLLPCMVRSGKGRIVNVSSGAHYRGHINLEKINTDAEIKYSYFSLYLRSKLANVLFTRELNKKLQSTACLTTYSLHPGCIPTGIMRNKSVVQFVWFLLSPFLKSGNQGAQTTIYCAVEENIEKYSGLYFSDCAVKESSEESRDEEKARKLWELSEQMTGITFPGT